VGLKPHPRRASVEPLSLESRYKRDYQKISEEVSKLEERNRILQLSDEAIGQANRTSFEKLHQVFHKSSSQYIKDIVLSEIARVKAFWLDITRIEDVSFSKKEPDGTRIEDKNFTTPELISALLENKEWKIRARAAHLLKDRESSEVPEALLKAIKGDTNLEVVRESIRSLEKIIGYVSPDALDYEAAESLWEKHAKEVNKRLLPQ
jgi:hypothetical protein